MKELSTRKIAIILVHSMRRLLTKFEPHERTKHMELVLKRLKKYNMHQEKVNKREFIFAIEFERVFWQNVTDKYDKETPVFGVNFVADLYTAYEQLLHKQTKISFKHIENMGKDYLGGEIESKKMREIEDNNDSLVNTYIDMFEPYSGVARKRSAFAGKKLIIKGNLITEGKEVKEGF